MKISKWLFYLSILMVCVLGFYFRPDKLHFVWQKLPVYDALMGFVGCLAIVIVSKALGHNWLQKKEDLLNQVKDIKEKQSQIRKMLNLDEPAWILPVESDFDIIGMIVLVLV